MTQHLSLPPSEKWPILTLCCESQANEGFNSALIYFNRKLLDSLSMRVIRRASMSDETSEGNYKTGVFAIWTEFHRSGGISNLRLRGLLGTENHFHYPSVVSVKQVNQFPVLSGHRSNSAAVVAIKPLPEPLSHDAEGVAHLMEADGGG